MYANYCYFHLRVYFYVFFLKFFWSGCLKHFNNMHRDSVQIVVVKPLKPFKNSSRVSIMSGLTTTTYTESNETMTTKYFTVGQWGRKRTEQKNNNGKLLPRGYMGFWTGIEKPLMCKKRNVQNFTFFLKRPFIISLSL